MRIGRVLPRAGGDRQIGVRSELVDGGVDADTDEVHNLKWLFGRRVFHGAGRVVVTSNSLTDEVSMWRIRPGVVRCSTNLRPRLCPR